MNTIVWSDLAYLSFNDAVDYLTENNSLDAAIKFDEEVEKLLERLRSFKHFARLTNCDLNCANALSTVILP